MLRSLTLTVLKTQVKLLIEWKSRSSNAFAFDILGPPRQNEIYDVLYADSGGAV